MANSTLKQKYGCLPSTQSAWAGNTLKFNITPSNVKLYHFTAFSSSGIAVESLFTIRSADNILRWKNVTIDSSNTASGSYSNGVVTVTLPSSEYWLYQLKEEAVFR